MRKKLFPILLSFSLVFLFLTISKVHGAGWNDVETWSFNVYGEGWNNVESWTFNLQSSPVSITIILATNPSGLNVRLDGGVWYASPKQFVISSGTNHSIECQSPQTGGTGKQYVWTSWSDTGTNPHNVNPTVDTTYTATYKTQYYFLVTSAHDGATGQGWYDSGTSGVHSTVTSPSEGYVTTGWVGTGSLASGGTRGSTDTGTFTITQYTTCTWTWELITWHNAESWTFKLNSITIGSWRNIETWSFNVVDLADWKNVEAWTFNLNEIAGWNNVEVWSFTLSQVVGWKSVESWIFDLNSEPLWKLVESWTFTLNSTAEVEAWHTVESWTFTHTVITYPYQYIIHGPYYENGIVANCTTSLTLHRQTESPSNFVFDGTDGQEDTVTMQAERKAWFLTWNASAYNVTRVYYLTNAFVEEIWIYVSHPDTPIYLYTFTITDFAGVTNAYLETIINVNGQNRVVERHRLDMLGPVPFWMYWANRYDLRLICDQGSYTWGGFIALTENNQNLIITKDMFPTSYLGMNVTVKALRMNSTWIQTNYTDAQTKTSWVKVDIQYRQGYGWTTVYTINNTGNTHKIDWFLADGKTDYVVKVTALRNGDLKTWSFNCPKLGVPENPFEGLFESLGNWPIPPSQIAGLFIVLAVFAVFSYAYMPLGCVLGVLTAMFLTYIGWLQISWSLLDLSMVIAIFAVVSQAKKWEREL